MQLHRQLSTHIPSVFIVRVLQTERRPLYLLPVDCHLRFHVVELEALSDEAVALAHRLARLKPEAHSMWDSYEIEIKEEVVGTALRSAT